MNQVWLVGGHRNSNHIFHETIGHTKKQWELLSSVDNSCGFSFFSNTRTFVTNMLFKRWNVGGLHTLAGHRVFGQNDASNLLLFQISSYVSCSAIEIGKSDAITTI